MTVVQKDGKTYYVFPDVAHNLAYVGGPKEYETYRQIRLQKKKARRDTVERERRTNRVGRLGLLRGVAQQQRLAFHRIDIPALLSRSFADGERTPRLGGSRQGWSG